MLPRVLLSVGTVRQPRKTWPSVAVAREVDEAGAVLAGLGQGDARRLGDFGEKLMRHLDENAGAVTGVGFAAGGATVIEIREHLKGVGDDLVRFAALHIDDEADAAGVMLEGGVVKSLFTGTHRGRAVVVEGIRGGGGVVVHGVEKDGKKVGGGRVIRPRRKKRAVLAGARAAQELCAGCSQR